MLILEVPARISTPVTYAIVAPENSFFVDAASWRAFPLPRVAREFCWRYAQAVGLANQRQYVHLSFIVYSVVVVYIPLSKKNFGCFANDNLSVDSQIVSPESNPPREKQGSPKQELCHYPLSKATRGTIDKEYRFAGKREKDPSLSSVVIKGIVLQSSQWKWDLLWKLLPSLILSSSCSLVLYCCIVPCCGEHFILWRIVA